MAKITPLSGFPEWLPADRLVEQHVIDVFREVAELHGFANIETRAVEPMNQLLRKGEIDKEVYVVSRLHAEDGEDAPAADGEDRRLGLHFDLTVPLARYVLENQGRLEFPFRRYQVQKVWRGERPQDGRFREFYQADLDIIGQNALPAHMDADVAIVMADILRRLPLPGGFRMAVNNRKLSEAVFTALGLTDTPAVLRELDKIAKIGPEEVRRQLMEKAGATGEQADGCLAFAQIRAGADDLADRIAALGLSSDDIDAAVEELAYVIRTVDASAPGVCEADLSIARGLDYYTGTVVETFVEDHEDLGSICSGGRYDTLAADRRFTYPGVGLSIGLSRLVSRLVTRQAAVPTRSVPTAVLVIVESEQERLRSTEIARELRERGIAAEVSPTSAKFGKQIRYADRRGIPFVWFPSEDGGTTGDVKDIRSGEQVQADARTWEIPAEDARVRITTAE